jgi:hypothetical protein
MAEECSTHREKVNSYRILVAEPDGETTLGRLNVGGRIILKRIVWK